MKRWRNLRYTFKREHQKYVKSGSSMTKKAKYCYYVILSFLQPSLIGRTTEGNIVHENENDIEDINMIDSPGSAEGQETVPTNATKVTPKPNAQKLSTFQEHLLNAIEKNRTQTTRQEEFDENKHFLLSLLPSMRKMDTKNNFHFRIEVMECMKKYMTPTCLPRTTYLAPSIIPQSERPYYQAPSELYPLPPYQYQNAIPPPQLDISSQNLQPNYLNISSSSTTQNYPNTNYSHE